MKLSYAASFALALVMVAAAAKADDTTVSIDPARARHPSQNELAIAMGPIVGRAPWGTWLGVERVDAAYGLPLDVALRMSMPLLESAGTVRGGSGALGLTIARSLRIGPVSLGAQLELGAHYGAGGAEAAGEHFASRAGVDTGVALRATLEPLHLAAIAWTRDENGVHLELAWSGWDDAIALRVGHGFAPLAERTYAGVGVRLRHDVELGAFAASSVDGQRVGGLSLRWTVADASTWWHASGLDMKELHAEDLRGRDLASLAVPGKITVIEFGAAWCGPCARARPHLETLAKRDDVAVRTIDVDECPAFAHANDVSSVPTFVVIDRLGTERRRHGYGEDLETWVLTPPPADKMPKRTRPFGMSPAQTNRL